LSPRGVHEASPWSSQILIEAPSVAGGAFVYTTEVSAMAHAAAAQQRSWRGRLWPMTSQAWEALTAEVARLNVEVLANDGYVTGRLDGEADAPTFVPNVVGQQLLARLLTVRDVLEGGIVVDDAALAVIGRRITLTEPDGPTSEYALVIPGDGDPRGGLVAADSPVGAALLNRRVGDAVVIAAPDGSWSATISAIE
jgi:hypothetical protein